MWRLVAWSISVALLLGGGACTTAVNNELSGKGGDTDTGPDAAGNDAGDPNPDGGGPDARVDGMVIPPDAGRLDCEGLVDGTRCGSGAICIDETCRNSQCGDGIVDENQGEQCDDGNTTPDDGCEPDCTYTCEPVMGDAGTPEAGVADGGMPDAGASEAGMPDGGVTVSECDDGDPCNGRETCDATTHQCQAGTPPAASEAVACELEGADAGMGTCKGGVCATASCGDGTPDPNEECDDGNTTSGDGCEPDCTYTCESDADCDDGNPCNGEETCNTTDHTCTAGDALDCDDGDPCTEDTCDPTVDGGCVSEFVDGDGDGYAPEGRGTCGDSGMGGDCNDDNNQTYPGASELCDDNDNDCDDTVDEDTTTITCYKDTDEDEYGVEDNTMENCQCPDGWTAKSDSFDCYDRNADVHPGASFQSVPYCDGIIETRMEESDGWGCYQQVLCINPPCSGSPTRIDSGHWDYDCDGTEEKQNTATGVTSCTSASCKSGWQGSSVPACGESAAFQSCLFLCLGSTCSCNSDQRTEPQRCR